MNTDKIYAEQIANEYSKKDTTKVNQLKKLDRQAKKGARLFAYIFGIVGALVLGTGMCFCLGALGDGSKAVLIYGTIIGVVGLAMVGFNFPIYNKILERGKEKYAQDILALAKEITDEQ